MVDEAMLTWRASKVLAHDLFLQLISVQSCLAG